MVEISGRTKIAGIIADPIGHVRAPQMFNPVLADQGTDAVVMPFHIAKDDLDAAWPQIMKIRNLLGFFVTVPHKTAVARLSDRRLENATMVGAANIVRRESDGSTVCEAYDGVGFVEGMRAHGYEPAGKRILLLGAGGAGASIAAALALEGVEDLVIANRTPARTDALIDRIRSVRPRTPVRAGRADPRGFEIVVNATSLGLSRDDPLPVDTTLLKPGQLVCEIIMDPETTPLLAAAKLRGCQVHFGKPMLEAQKKLLLSFLGLWQD